MHPLERTLIGVACVPLAAYLVWLGSRNIGLHPKLTSGMADLTALVVGFAGMVAVGPTLALAQMIDPWSMVALAVLVTAWVALAAYREVDSYVVYNCNLNPFWAALTASLDDLALTYSRQRNQIDLDGVDVQLTVEPFASLRNVTLYIRCAGDVQLAPQLVSRLRHHLAQVESHPYAIGWCFLASGCVLLAVTAIVLLSNTGAS